MATRRDSDQRQAVARLEHELLARLGLGTGASNDEVESAHEEVVQYLEAAPPALRAWSQTQVAAADEAYAVLRGPRADLLAMATAAAALSSAPGPAPETTPRIRGAAAPQASSSTFDDIDDIEAARDGALGRAPADRVHGPEHRGAGRTARGGRQIGSARVGGPVAGVGRTARRLLLAAGGVVAVVAVVVLVYNLGSKSVPGFTGTPAPEASTAGVDPARLAALMTQLAANPNDTATLQSIGDLYYEGGDYATAATWMEKILTIDPKNVNALLALGAVKFNVGSTADAEAEWRQVLTIDPKNVEAHYDLGFMYLSANPPDIAKVKLEWNEVIALAPDSDVAKTVATHLQSLDAAASPGTSGSPAPSASGSAAPAPSTAPVSPAPSTSSGGG